MSEGVTVIVTWTIKPEFADAFVESLRGMFPETRLRKGFRNIRLLRSDTDPNQFVLIEEWDEAKNFQDYAQFRVETGDTAKLLAMTASSPQIGVWAVSPLAYRFNRVTMAAALRPARRGRLRGLAMVARGEKFQTSASDRSRPPVGRSKEMARADNSAHRL
jgi:quinol monooxygenase YgiN